MEDKWIFLAVTAFIGAGFAYVGGTFLLLWAKLLEKGKRAAATVVDVSLSTKVRGSKRRRRRVTVYACTLEFMADHGRQTFKLSTEQARVVGDKIEIAYLPDNPGKFMPVEQLADSAVNKILPPVAVVIGVALLIGSAIIAFL